MPDLFGQFPQPGRVEWIGVRPQRQGRLVGLRDVRAIKEVGLQGDHYGGGANGKRHLTLIQHEHLSVVAKLLALRDKTPTVPQIDPALVRRNIVISGLNLLALKNHRFRLGEALLEFTAPCQPCSAMEEALGPRRLQRDARPRRNLRADCRGRADPDRRSAGCARSRQVNGEYQVRNMKYAAPTRHSDAHR